jgi:hypothetical protein
MARLKIQGNCQTILRQKMDIHKGMLCTQLYLIFFWSKQQEILKLTLTEQFLIGQEDNTWHIQMMW